MNPEREKILANQDLSVFYPEDLDAALAQIARSSCHDYQQASPQAGAYPSKEWSTTEDGLDTVAYYLGYAIHWNLLGDRESESTPFQDLEKLSLPRALTESSLDILRFGCAGEMSIVIELEKLRQAGIRINSHTTVDLSPIPIGRIKSAGLETDAVQENACNLHFPDHSFDLFTSDQILGSNEREKERALLSELYRVGKDQSYLIMKVFCGLGTQGLRPHTGLKWRAEAIEKYGETNGRDGYIGLTEDQWQQLGERYVRFVNNAYFNPLTSYCSIKEIGAMLATTGFGIEQSLDYETKKVNGPERTGDFIILARKI
jgi:hypothetical protein